MRYRLLKDLNFTFKKDVVLDDDMTVLMEKLVEHGLAVPICGRKPKGTYDNRDRMYGNIYISEITSRTSLYKCLKGLGFDVHEDDSREVLNEKRAEYLRSLNFEKGDGN